jgi:hypothetical protein
VVLDDALGAGEITEYIDLGAHYSDLGVHYLVNLMDEDDTRIEITSPYVHPDALSPKA